jgi:beta-N-acetylhexosaminidase
VRVRAGSGRIGLHAPQVELLDRLAAGTEPVVLVALGNPYVGLHAPAGASVVAAYDASDAVLGAVARALYGEAEVSGRIPVGLPGRFPTGTGIDRQAVRPAVFLPEEFGMDPRLGRRVDSLMAAAIREGAFPGAAVAVGRGEDAVLIRGYGHYSHDRRRPVDAHLVFDLASLTKPLATTLAVMKLHEEGRLDIDAPVARYLPEFAQHGKDAVLVRHLLAHESGLRVHHPFHLRGATSRREVLEFIYRDTLRHAPGTETHYGDPGMIILGEVVARVAGEPLDRYVSRTFYEPLGLAHTGFRSVGVPDTSVVPTERDDAFRGRLIQGEVHDETAWIMGGVAGHAGLFSSAADLARLAGMLAAGGVFDGRRYLEAETIRRFTERVSPYGSHPVALGWITIRPPEEGYSSAGTLMGPRAFGHTGFTGTSIWIDPDTGLYVVLLSNRVHPSRDNDRIGRVRPQLADVVAGSLRNFEATATR